MMGLKFPARARLRQYLPLFLMTAGLSLLLYVATQYGSMWLEQRRLAREWQEQQQRPATPDLQPVSLPDGLTRLSIPKISLNAIVVEGTSRRDLLLGPGHIQSTPTPGEPGNSVITGHRDTFFRHIYELSRGDIVTVQRGGKTYRYEVTGKKIVAPEDMSVVQPSNDNRLTLITCYPTYYIGPAPERLVVFSRLADGPAGSPADSRARAATAK